MKKRFLPNDIKDLENIYYGNDNDRKKRYEGHVDSETIDPKRETRAKEILNGFGESQKIPRRTNRTPDYEIVKNRIVYEITSIQLSEDERISHDVRQRNERDFVNDINEKIEHALEKDYSYFQDYLRGVVIFYDEVLSSLTKYVEYVSNRSIIEKTIFKKSDIDFMVIEPIPHSSNKKLVHVVYVKENKTLETFKNKFPKEFEIICVDC